jgi:hypothetical protein
MRRLSQDEKQELMLAQYQEGVMAEARTAGKSTTEVGTAGAEGVKTKAVELSEKTVATRKSGDMSVVSNADDGGGGQLAGTANGNAGTRQKPWLQPRSKPRLGGGADQACATDHGSYYRVVQDAVNNVLGHTQFRGIADQDALTINTESAGSGVQDSC